jgi:hypothetical protein
MNLEEYRALGSVIDTTWGRSSTNNKYGPTVSIKPSLLNAETMVISYTCLINFGEAHEREREFHKKSMDSAAYLDAVVKRIKDDFKEVAGRSLKVEQVGDDEDWELLNLGQYSGRKDAYYKRKIILSIE